MSLSASKLHARRMVVLEMVNQFFLINPEKERVSFSDLIAMQVPSLPAGILRPVISGLCESEHLERKLVKLDVFNSNSEEFFYLTHLGLSELEEFQAINNSSQESTSDYSKYVKIDAADERASAAMEATESLLKRVETDNAFSADYPDVKSGLVSTLRSGLDVLRGGIVTSAQYATLLKKPAGWLAENFAKTTLGELAKSAAQLLMKLFPGW